MGDVQVSPPTEGTRGRWPLRAAVALLVLPILLAPPVAASAPTGGPSAVPVDWPEFQFDLANSGHNPSETVIGPDNVATLTQAWVVRTGAVWGAMALVRGVIYVAGTTDTGSTILTAIRARTGERVWKRRLSDAAALSGLAFADGSLYLGTDDHLFHAVDARTGRTRWSSAVGGTPQDPAVDGGLVYFGTVDGVIHALDAATGEEVWSFRNRGGIIGGSPAVVGGLVYIGTWDHWVYALDAATGDLAWEFQTGWEIAAASPSIAEGVLYIQADNMDLYAIDAATGDLRWQVETGPQMNHSPRAAAVADGVVYAGANGYVMAFAASDGTLLWMEEIAESMSSTVVANGVVYVPDFQNNFWALDAQTGAPLWSFTAGNQVRDGFIVANGMVFAGSFDRNVYAFELPG